MSYGVVNPDDRGKGPAGAVYRLVRPIPPGGLWLLVVLWGVPPVGLLVNSSRTLAQQRTSGGWTVGSALGHLTLGNYRQVLGTTAAGGMKQGLTNSFAIALPATIIPIAF